MDVSKEEQQDSTQLFFKHPRSRGQQRKPSAEHDHAASARHPVSESVSTTSKGSGLQSQKPFDDHRRGRQRNTSRVMTSVPTPVIRSRSLPLAIKRIAIPPDTHVLRRRSHATSKNISQPCQEEEEEEAEKENPGHKRTTSILLHPKDAAQLGDDQEEDRPRVGNIRPGTVDLTGLNPVIADGSKSYRAGASQDTLTNIRDGLSVEWAKTTKPAVQGKEVGEQCVSNDKAIVGQQSIHDLKAKDVVMLCGKDVASDEECIDRDAPVQESDTVPAEQNDGSLPPVPVRSNITSAEGGEERNGPLETEGEEYGEEEEEKKEEEEEALPRRATREGDADYPLDEAAISLGVDPLLDRDNVIVPSTEQDADDDAANPAVPLPHGKKQSDGYCPNRRSLWIRSVSTIIFLLLLLPASICYFISPHCCEAAVTQWRVLMVPAPQQQQQPVCPGLERFEQVPASLSEVSATLSTLQWTLSAAVRADDREDPLLQSEWVGATMQRMCERGAAVRDTETWWPHHPRRRRRGQSGGGAVESMIDDTAGAAGVGGDECARALAEAEQAMNWARRVLVALRDDAFTIRRLAHLMGAEATQVVILAADMAVRAAEAASADLPRLEIEDR